MDRIVVLCEAGGNADFVFEFVRDFMGVTVTRATSYDRTFGERPTGVYAELTPDEKTLLASLVPAAGTGVVTPHVRSGDPAIARVGRDVVRRLGLARSLGVPTTE